MVSLAAELLEWCMVSVESSFRIAHSTFNIPPPFALRVRSLFCSLLAAPSASWGASGEQAGFPARRDPLAARHAQIPACSDSAFPVTVRAMKRITIATLLTLSLVLPLVAQQPAKPNLRELTLESIYDPKDRVAFSGATQGGFVWIDDKTFAWPHTNEKSEVTEWLLYDTDSGKTRPLFDPVKLRATLKNVQGLTEEVAAKLVKPRNWNFSPGKHSVLLSAATDLYLYDFDKDALTRITTAPGEEEEASFSPDGKSIAFIRNNNLFVADLTTQKEAQLTKDGSDEVFNGSLDWVYQEEVYGRGNFHAYWWSPDSRHLAFLRLDEKPVKRFTIVDHIPTMQNVEQQPYPKAGYPNPIAKLFTVGVEAGAAPVEIDTHQYNEFLVVKVAWSPDSRRVLYQVQNREQTWLDLNSAASGAAPQTLFRESTKAWIEPSGNPVWLKDGSFLWLSERDERAVGGAHAARRRRRGALPLCLRHGALGPRHGRLSRAPRRQRSEAPLRRARRAQRRL